MNQQNVCLILACVLIIAGVALVFPPAAFIVAGILLGVLVFTSEW